MDQNFLVSIDPNLEEITNFFSLYWSQSRGDYKFQSKLFERLKNVKNWHYFGLFFCLFWPFLTKIITFNPCVIHVHMDLDLNLGKKSISPSPWRFFPQGYIETTLSGPEFSSLYWSQPWVNWFLIWNILTQPWVDQTFPESKSLSLDQKIFRLQF